MPVNLLSIIVNWFATHLVVFSLLGFLYAGLLVFGLIDMPGTGPATEATEAPATAKPRPKAGASSAADLQPATKAVPDEAGNMLNGTGEGDEQSPPGKPYHPAPRLIGGSLPIYGQPGESSSIPGSMRAPAAGSFRPPGEVAPSGPVRMTRDDYLQQARRAFWNGEFETAEAAYMALISEYPADADAFGELGNLYQSMGKPDRAKDAYYEAGIRLKAAGETEKLKEIIELLERDGDERVERFTP